MWGGGFGSGPTQPKCQNLSKSTFGGEGVGGADQLNQSAKICPNLHLGEGVGGPDQLNQSAKICPNVHLGRGVVVQANIPEILEWGTLKEF